MKLRSKLFLTFSLLAILPILIISAFARHRYEDLTKLRMTEYSGTLFENASKEANATLESIRQNMSYLTSYTNDTGTSLTQTLKLFSNPEKSFNSYDIFSANRYCTSIFRTLISCNDYILGIHIFTPSDIVFSSAISSEYLVKEDYPFSSDDWYQKTLALDGKFYVSADLRSNMFIKNHDSIYFAGEFKDIYSHKFMGIVLLECRADVLNLDNINTMPKVAMLTLENTDTGEVLYSNVDKLSRDFSSSHRKILKEKLSISPLSLSAVYNYDALYKEFNITGAVFLIIALLCILSYLILSYPVLKQMIRPIEQLSKSMASLKGSSLSFQNPYGGRQDEIGILYNEYEQMLQQLNISIKRDYKDKLLVLDAQMKSLEARINSHFLFNTLESINSMAELNDNEEISTMSVALGNMFRYAIKTQSELVTLEEELDHVNDYFTIQNIRFDGAFTLENQIPRQMYSCTLLKLILQPLVENALYHGLDYCRAGDKICLKGSVKDNILCLSVADNGKGMEEKTLREIRKRLLEDASFQELGHRSKQSIGLKNIHSRIVLYYGKNFGLSVESRPDWGTCVTIKIPLLKPYQET